VIVASLLLQSNQKLQPSSLFRHRHYVRHNELPPLLRRAARARRENMLGKKRN
jgi:hypothetical protein